MVADDDGDHWGDEEEMIVGRESTHTVSCLHQTLNPVGGFGNNACKSYTLNPPAC